MKIIVLDTTTKTIRAALSSAVATSNPDFVVAYADTSDNTFSELSSDGQLNGTTDVTLVGAPASGVKRTIKSISVYNRDTAPVIVVIKLDVSGTQRILQRVQLVSGETWHSDELTKLSPGGSDTQVQFNDTGTLAGSSNFTYNKTTSVLTLGANPVLTAGTANGILYLNGSKAATTGSALTFDGTKLLASGSAAAAYLNPFELKNTDGTGYLNFAITVGSAQSTIRYAPGIFFKIGPDSGDTTTPLVFAVNNGTEQMRLTSTGLGIGTSSPATKLDVTGLVRSTTGINIGASIDGTTGGFTRSGGDTYLDYAGTLRVRSGAVSERVILDTSGNLGLGVTPSAWSSGYKAIEFGSGSIYGRANATDIYLASNSYLGASTFIYKYTGAASYYSQALGGHYWFNAPSGTAGNAITFTQAMTLDASGNLLVGKTSTAVNNTTGAQISPSGITLSTNTGSPIIDLRASRASVAANIGGIVSFSAVYENSASDTTNIAYIKGLRENATNNNWSSYISFETTNGTTLAERARITSGGYFKASNSGTYTNAALYHEFYQTANNEALVVRNVNASQTSGTLFVQAERNTTNNTFYAIDYYNGGAAAYKFRVADSGNVTNTNGSYGTISDAKMKTDIVDAGSQWADIKAIRFRKFKMKDDPSGLLQLGVVAQELEQTSPGLVDEHVDRDAEGNDLGTTTKSVKTSILLMKAAKALQEAMTRIETLEAKVAALEGTQP